MTTLILLLAAATMLVLAMLMTLVLGWANRAFHVEVNPLVEKALDILPGANCGGCGYVGCSEYAEAVVTEGERPDKCPVGGEGCSKALAMLMGLDLTAAAPYRAVVHCAAHTDDLTARGDYRGEPTCASANLVSGVISCTYGCLGLGDCERSCPFDAIHVLDGLATVDYDKCVGCGACERACPRHIISMVPFKQEQMLVVKCSNKDFGKDVKAVCRVGCIGCGACARIHGDLFSMEDNLPAIDYETYEEQTEGLEAAVAKCPIKSLVYVGAPSETDKAAVADEEVPDVVQPDFKTTVDDTEWHG